MVGPGQAFQEIPADRPFREDGTGGYRPRARHLQGDHRTASRQDPLPGRGGRGERVHLHRAGLRGAAMNGERILIVDDEADIALIIKLQLEDAGYKTVRARDGVEALEHIGREKFALILLDIKMPRMDGMQVLGRIQQEHPDAGVVMMTAHGSEDIAVEAMKKGAIDYIAKPFSTDDMVKKVER